MIKCLVQKTIANNFNSMKFQSIKITQSQSQSQSINLSGLKHINKEFNDDEDDYTVSHKNTTQASVITTITETTTESTITTTITSRKGIQKRLRRIWRPNFNQKSVTFVPTELSFTITPITSATHSSKSLTTTSSDLTTNLLSTNKLNNTTESRNGLKKTFIKSKFSSKVCFNTCKNFGILFFRTSQEKAFNNDYFDNKSYD